MTPLLPSVVVLQAYYGIPAPIRNQAMTYLDDRLVEIVESFESTYPFQPNK